MLDIGIWKKIVNKSTREQVQSNSRWSMWWVCRLWESVKKNRVLIKISIRVLFQCIENPIPLQNTRLMMMVFISFFGNHDMYLIF